MIPHYLHVSVFVLATIIFVFDTPKNASTFVKACNERRELQTFDLQPPLMAQ